MALTSKAEGPIPLAMSAFLSPARSTPLTRFGTVRRNGLMASLLAVLLSACVSSGPVPPKRPTTAKPPRPAATIPAVRPPMRYRPRNPQVQALPGLEGVIGQTVDGLTRQFGPARLDVWEGDARKLQFAGTACVLDIYLYPEAQGKEPQATYVDARRQSDGQDVDRAACIAALRLKQPG